MFGFGSARRRTRYGLVLDIGSASVLGAIVASDHAADHPEIIWSEREHIPLRARASTTDTAKHVLSSFMNLLMAFDTAGRAALRTHDPNASLTQLQISIAAPWSYTITKTIRHERPSGETVTVTRDLIDDLLAAAAEKTETELKENELTDELGLAITARMVTDLAANGYPLEGPNDQPAQTVSLSHSSVITQAYLRDAISEGHEKVLPRSERTTYSFMLIYYCVMRDLHPHLTEYCLIDVTYEATEIAIVRDGILRYCTHTPFGAYSLAREVAAVSNLPLAEAYAHITGPDLASLREQVNEEQNRELDTLFSKYEERLAKLLTETGDDLSVPKQLIVHSTLNTEGFFRERLEKASQAVTHNRHLITTASLPLITATFPKDRVTEYKKRGADSACFVSAQFFHQCHHCDKVRV